MARDLLGLTAAATGRSWNPSSEAAAGIIGANNASAGTSVENERAVAVKIGAVTNRDDGRARLRASWEEGERTRVRARCLPGSTVGGEEQVVARPGRRWVASEITNAHTEILGSSEREVRDEGPYRDRLRPVELPDVEGRSIPSQAHGHSQQVARGLGGER